MVLAGVYELTRVGGLPRETFRLMHQSIAGLELARVSLSRGGRSRYLMVTRALYYINDVDDVTLIRPLRPGEVVLQAFRSLFRVRKFLKKTRRFVKGCLRRNLRDFEDVLEIDAETTWAENLGRVESSGLRFDDGFCLEKTSFVLRKEPFSSDRLALYAHYDAGPDLSPADLKSLAHLRNAGYDVALLSTSLSMSCAQRLGGVNAVLVRPNVGHDFLSWRLGLEEFPSESRRARYLVFTNNSMEIQGSSTLSALQELVGSLVCLTDSFQVRHHAESVWWQVDTSLLPFDLVRDFFAQVVAYPAKQAIIRAYEIGFTAYLESAGYSILALWPYAVVIAALEARRDRFALLYHKLRSEGTLNPSKHLHQVLKDLGVDILKKTSKLEIA